MPSNDDKDIMMKDYVAHSRFGAVGACVRDVVVDSTYAQNSGCQCEKSEKKSWNQARAAVDVARACDGVTSHTTPHHTTAGSIDGGQQHQR